MKWTQLSLQLQEKWLAFYGRKKPVWFSVTVTTDQWSVINVTHHSSLFILNLSFSQNQGQSSLGTNSARLVFNSVFQAESSSVRRALSSNMHRPYSSGSSVSLSCFSTGRLLLSLPACRETPWRCWPEEGRWDLLGENIRWTPWEVTLSHIPSKQKTCPCCRLGTCGRHTDGWFCSFHPLVVEWI